MSIGEEPNLFHYKSAPLLLLLAQIVTYNPFQSLSGIYWYLHVVFYFILLCCAISYTETQV